MRYQVFILWDSERWVQAGEAGNFVDAFKLCHKDAIYKVVNLDTNTIYTVRDGEIDTTP